MNKPLSLSEAHTQLTRICKLSTTWSVVASIVTPYFVRISSLSRLVIASSILHDKWSMKLSLCRFFHFENKFLFLFMLSLLCIATGPHCYLYISCDSYISYVCYVWSMHLFSLYVLFSQFRPRDVLMGILLLSFLRTCAGEEDCSLEYYPLV